MAKILFWDTDPFGWDILSMDGVNMPGISRVDAKISRKIEVKKASGAHGAILRDQGYEPADVKITIQIWDQAQLDALAEIVDKIRPRPNATPKAVDVVHPKLRLLGIRSIYIKEISSLDETEPGLYEISIDSIEFIPIPKGANANKGAGVIPKAPKPREFNEGGRFSASPAANAVKPSTQKSTVQP